MNKKEADSHPSFDWSNLIGFSNDLQRAQGLFLREKLPQVILFSGREGIGKKIYLQKLLALLYCDTQSACGACPSCQDLRRNDHGEMLWIDPSGAFKLQEGRMLQEHLELSPSHVMINGESRLVPRIVCLVDIDRATDQAANQMLKTLEEPNPGTFVFMTTSKPRQILDTILSRTVRWYLQPPPPEQGLPWLLGKFSDQFDEETIKKVYVNAGYSIGKSLHLLEGQNSEEFKQLDQLLRTLIFSKNLSQAMDAATTLTRQLKLGVNDLAIRIELLLNQYYRWRLDLLEQPDRAYFDQVRPQIDGKTLRRWRQSLATMRQLAGRSQIPLNAQMMAETFAMTR